MQTNTMHHYMLTYIIGNMDKMDGYLLYTLILLKCELKVEIKKY